MEENTKFEYKKLLTLAGVIEFIAYLTYALSVVIILINVTQFFDSGNKEFNYLLSAVYYLFGGLMSGTFFLVIAYVIPLFVKIEENTRKPEQKQTNEQSAYKEWLSKNPAKSINDYYKEKLQ